MSIWRKKLKFKNIPREKTSPFVLSISSKIWMLHFVLRTASSPHHSQCMQMYEYDNSADVLLHIKLFLIRKILQTISTYISHTAYKIFVRPPIVLIKKVEPLISVFLESKMPNSIPNDTKYRDFGFNFK